MLAENPVQLDVRIPYISQLHYDEQGYQSFPIRRGYAFNKQGFVDLQHRSEEILSFYQEWLYFGLMTEFFGHPVAVKDFVQEINGFRHVNTSRLPFLIQNWRQRIYQSSTSDADRSIERAKACFLLATKYCTYLDQPQVIGHLAGPWIEIVFRSKSCLAPWPPIWSSNATLLTFCCLGLKIVFLNRPRSRKLKGI